MEAKRTQKNQKESTEKREKCFGTMPYTKYGIACLKGFCKVGFMQSLRTSCEDPFRTLPAFVYLVAYYCQILWYREPGEVARFLFLILEALKYWKTSW